MPVSFWGLASAGQDQTCQNSNATRNGPVGETCNPQRLHAASELVFLAADRLAAMTLHRVSNPLGLILQAKTWSVSIFEVRPATPPEASLSDPSAQRAHLLIDNGVFSDFSRGLARPTAHATPQRNAACTCSHCVYRCSFFLLIVWSGSSAGRLVSIVGSFLQAGVASWWDDLAARAVPPADVVAGSRQ